MSRLLVVLGVALIVATAIFTIAFTWWWALAGMSEDVGTACIVTATVMFIFGVALTLGGAEL